MTSGNHLVLCKDWIRLCLAWFENFSNRNDAESLQNIANTWIPHQNRNEFHNLSQFGPVRICPRKTSLLNGSPFKQKTITTLHFVTNLSLFFIKPICFSSKVHLDITGRMFKFTWKAWHILAIIAYVLMECIVETLVPQLRMHKSAVECTNYVRKIRIWFKSWIYFL